MGGGPPTRLVKLPENSGDASVPRNVGLNLSRGIYVTFVDADDMIKPDALEILNNTAVKTDADVVHAEGFLTLIGGASARYTIQAVSSRFFD